MDRGKSEQSLVTCRDTFFNVRTYLLLIFSVLLGNWAYSQNDSIANVQLDSVVLSVTRLPITSQQLPYSVAEYRASSIQQTRQQLSLQEYLNFIPGLFSLNANNYAQDLRISIRGFGARSAFGIRGVKIIVDGIPETTPDGQGQIDNLDVGSVERIEVLKGPSSALFGNASGGIINMSTPSDLDADFIQAASSFGSFGFQQYQLQGGAKTAKTRALFQGSHTRTNGFRQQSALENTHVQGRIFHDFSEASRLNFQVSYTDSPIAQDPGSLTLEGVAEDREQAFARNVLFDTGEVISQFKTGLRYQYQPSDKHLFTVYGFYSRRNFEGRIPVPSSGWIDLGRNYFGQGASYQWTANLAGGKNRLVFGYEWAQQSDDRRRFANNEGVQGNLVLDQQERFFNWGSYLLNDLTLDKWVLSAGIRYDRNLLKADDQKLDDGDQSGERSLPAFSPSVGINYQIRPGLNAYANYRYSFETPALTELANAPSGQAGFNPDLDPQQANNYEIGIKGGLLNRLDFDLTYFHIDTRDDLVPFELADQPGRSFFRNAGSTTRDGVELLGRYRFCQGWSVTTAYAYSDFRYKDYQIDGEDFGGNRLPAIPENTWRNQLSYQSERLNFQLQHRYTDSFFADDANSPLAVERAYHVVDLSAGYQVDSAWGRWTPFIGINNLFDAQYSDNIRINAFGGRYYEPAAGLNVFGGIRWRLEK